MGNTTTKLSLKTELPKEWEPLKALFAMYPLPHNHPVWEFVQNLNLISIPEHEVEELIESHLFFQLLNSNVVSANFQSLIVLATSKLEEYRRLSNIPDRFCIPSRNLLSLCHVVAILIARLCLHCSTAECLFHLEHVPLEDVTHAEVGKDIVVAGESTVHHDKGVPPEKTEIENGADIELLKDKGITLAYRGKYKHVLPAYNASLSEIRNSIINIFSEHFSQDVWTLENRGFCFRDKSGELFTLKDVPRYLHNVQCEHVITIVPFGLPKRTATGQNCSVLSSFMAEICRFCCSTQGTLECYQNENILRLHRHLVRTLLILFSKITPKDYAVLSKGEDVLEASNTETAPDATPLRQGSVEWPPHRNPPYDSAHAQSAPLYYLYMQARQPFPHISSPTFYHSDSLIPILTFVEPFLEEGEICQDSEKDNGTTETVSCITQLGLGEIFCPPLNRIECFALYLLNCFWQSEKSNLKEVWVLHSSQKNRSDFPKFVDEAEISALLSDALSLFLLLNYYPTDEIRNQLNRGSKSPLFEQGNPFASVIYKLYDPRLFSLQNAVKGSSPGKAKRTFVATVNSSIPFNFRVLLKTFCVRGMEEHAFNFLLFILLHKNANFRRFCSSSLQSEEILLNLFKLLHFIPSYYNKKHHPTPVGNSVEDQIYPVTPPLAVILMLILFLLCEDRLLCERSQSLIFAKVTWSKIVALKNISLSSLLLLVVIRLYFWNFGNFHDNFLLKLCGATLVSLSSVTCDLHWYVADKFVGFSIVLTREMEKYLQNSNGASDYTKLGNVTSDFFVALCSMLSPDRLATSINLLYGLIRLNTKSYYKSVLIKMNESSIKASTVLKVDSSFLQQSNYLQDQHEVHSFKFAQDANLECHRNGIEKQAIPVSEPHGDNANVTDPLHFSSLVLQMEYLLTLLSFFETAIENTMEDASVEEIKKTLKGAAKKALSDNAILDSYHLLLDASILPLRYGFAETCESSSYFLPLIWKLLVQR